MLLHTIAHAVPCEPDLHGKRFARRGKLPPAAPDVLRAQHSGLGVRPYSRGQGKEAHDTRGASCLSYAATTCWVKGSSASLWAT